MGKDDQGQSEIMLCEVCGKRRALYEERDQWGKVHYYCGPCFFRKETERNGHEGKVSGGRDAR
jgi:hypothetical protein